MLEVCQKIAEDHGLVIEGAGWRGTDTGFFFEPVFRVSIPASDGTAFNLEKDRFEFLAEHFGLAPSDFGREFRTGSERFRITGIYPKRPRYPISAERIPDRRGFKFAAETSPCSSKPRRTSRDVLGLFRKLAKIAASGRLGLLQVPLEPASRGNAA
ncbi:hypothetical protein, partial [Mesorhizobium helmanticense]|uniref:hypothetical protein n=1 Tax=Mesorhizobium helmanticense TaxID=1776423 RepID=UPI001FE1C1C9